MSTAFQFISETHQYIVGEAGAERVVPSVTQILNGVGLVNYDHVPRSILDHKAEVGTAAHAACWFADIDDLNWDTLDLEVEPYVRAWLKFRNETDFIPELIEHRGIASVGGLQYGYTLDRTGLFQGKPTLIEIKCTANVEVSWAPQTAAYEMARRADGDVARYRMAVHLRPNGNYGLVPFRDVSDYAIFKAALAVESWKLAKNIERRERAA